MNWIQFLYKFGFWLKSYEIKSSEKIKKNIQYNNIVKKNLVVY